MSSRNTKNKPSYKLFAIFFFSLMVLVVMNNVRKNEVVFLSVSNNAGMNLLETAGKRLVAVFYDGQVVVWNWGSLTKQQADFSIQTDRAVLLDAQRLAAVNETGKKMLSVYNLLTGNKTKDISVGGDDQEVWPRVSFDKKSIVLIRRNSADIAGEVLYEFLTVDVEKELKGVPFSLILQDDGETLIDYAVKDSGIIYAVGGKGTIGRIAAMNLKTGVIVWDQAFDQTKEFCSVMVSPDNGYLLAGNRDGKLYKISAETGEILTVVQLLEPGETRPITNDFSVLNLAFSPDGQYHVATINPKVYLLETDTDEVFHTATPADRLVSRVAFSPDNQFFATSDVRQGFPIKIWPMPKQTE